MSPSTSIHRTNINLLTDDVLWLQQHYGRGWTTYVRDAIHQHIQRIQREQITRLYGPADNKLYTEGVDPQYTSKNIGKL